MDNKYITGLISVIIPTYKRSEYLKRSIMSVLNQTYNKLELLIVNDNKPDDAYSKNVRNLVNEINDNRVILLEPKEHRNGSFARNKGLEKAKGEFICFLDDDDYWDLNKLEKQYRRMADLEMEYIAVASLKLYVNKEQRFRAALPYKVDNILDRIIKRECDISTCTTMIRHNIIDKIGGFDVNLKRKQDVEFYIHLFQHGKLNLIEEHLTYIDISNDINNNLSFTELKKMNDDFFYSINDVLMNFSSKQIKILKKIYDFECGRHILKKEGKVIESLKFCFPAILSLTCLLSLGRRKIKGFIEYRFCDQIYNKYTMRKS